MTLAEKYDFNSAEDVIQYIRDDFKGSRFTDVDSPEDKARLVTLFIDNDQFIEFDIDLEETLTGININTEFALETFKFTNKEIYAILEAVKNDI